MEAGFKEPASRFDGALAQLGERLNGIQEVSGSIPLGSTSCSLRSVDVHLSADCDYGFNGDLLVDPSRGSKGASAWL